MIRVVGHRGVPSHRWAGRRGLLGPHGPIPRPGVIDGGGVVAISAEEDDLLMIRVVDHRRNVPAGGVPLALLAPIGPVPRPPFTQVEVGGTANPAEEDDGSAG